MKARRNGFTVVEILTVVTIIAILVGILIPSITAVRTMAKKTQQTAQLTTMALAISAFKNDYGDYPESDAMGWAEKINKSTPDYCGAHMLSEAMLGWDLMGFHPKSEWRADGRYEGTDDTHLYEVATLSSYSDDQQEENLRQRIGPYLDRSQVQVTNLEQLFESHTGNLADEEGFVICDVFKFKKIADSVTGKTRNIGAPILYYKANTQFKSIYPDESDFNKCIYNYFDNAELIQLKGEEDGRLADTAAVMHEWLDYQKFYGNVTGYEYSIKDPQITGREWPYRPDSYLLISAGPDGEYGTIDDITNFR
jgi:prepilin-type N-terminal cleavage/methylation domain-containing protein